MFNPGWDRVSTPHLAKKLIIGRAIFLKYASVDGRLVSTGSVNLLHKITCTTFSPLYWRALSYGSIMPSSVLKGRGYCRFPSSSIGFSCFHFPSLSTLHSFNPSAPQILSVSPCRIQNFESHGVRSLPCRETLAPQISFYPPSS